MLYINTSIKLEEKISCPYTFIPCMGRGAWTSPLNPIQLIALRRLRLFKKKKNQILEIKAFLTQNENSVTVHPQGVWGSESEGMFCVDV